MLRGFDIIILPLRQKKHFIMCETKEIAAKEIYLAGGCFWGTEHFFKQLEGVAETEVGFANGNTERPTYKEVYTDQTGYAETVRVCYVPSMVSLELLLRMFFKAIDPTSLNKQGHDEGTRYRTGIYYTEPADLTTIEKVFADEQRNYDQPIVVEIQPLKNFYAAEEYHQGYLDKNPDGYCHLPKSLFDYARQIRRILRMEHLLNRTADTVRSLSVALSEYESALEDVAELDKYYGSDEWRQDLADDEAGKLPESLKRGVLSEDAIWQLLDDVRELNRRLNIKP